MAQQDLPRGQVTFLFSDIEGSTRLWERHAEAMREVLEAHDAILRSAVADHGGVVVKMTGDGAYAAFEALPAALEAAVALQRRLQAQDWTAIQPDAIRARVGIHLGNAQPRGGDYHGRALNVAARLMSAGHGGQILISDAAASTAALPDRITLKALGRYRLKGIEEAQRIWQLNGPGLPADFPPLNAQNTAVRNLPGQPTPIVGRRQEMQEVQRLLLQTNCRLVTLVGPGGMGKTRLAVAAAEVIAAVGSRLNDGVVFVALAPVEDPAAIGRTVAEALGYALPGDNAEPNRQLLPLISEMRLLLLLDNLEHLLGDELDAFLEAVLAVAPGVTILATSRERLNLRAETVLALGGLDGHRSADETPTLREEEASDAVRLFLQSARRSLPAYELNADNARAIERICHLAGGVPLGIELAAGWLGVLSAQEIADDLQESLDLLSTTLRDVPPRQRSLRAVFEGSWARLTLQEQVAFLRLSVFRSGFLRLEGQEAAGVSLPVLLSLVNKSFLQRESDGRFGLHEQMRRFANERLQQDQQLWQEARQRHAETYAAYVAARLPRLRDRGQMQARGEIESDFGNIRAAWSWHVEQDAFEALVTKMLPGIYIVALQSMRFSEMQDLLDEALDRLSRQSGHEETAPYLALQTAVVDLFYNQLWHPPFLYRDGRALFQKLWPAADQQRRHMGVWFDIFLLHHLINVGDPSVRSVWDEHIAELRDAGEPWCLAYGLYSYAFALRITQMERTPPVQMMQEALALFNQVGDAFRAAWCRHSLGWMSHWQGDLDGAIEQMQQAQESLIGQGLDLHRARMIHYIASVPIGLGRPQDNLRYLAEEQAIYRRSNRLEQLKSSLHWESIMSSRFGSREHAFQKREEAMALGRRIARSLGEEEAAHLDFDYFELAELQRVAGDLGQARRSYEQARHGFVVTRNVIGPAFLERGLGDLALAEGKLDEAEARFRRYLEHARATRSFSEEAIALVALSRALTRLGRLEESEQVVSAGLQVVDNPAFVDLILWPFVALAELRAAQGAHEESALLASYTLHHPLVWLEMRDLMEGLLAELRPSLTPQFDPQSAAQEAALSLVPTLEMHNLPDPAVDALP